MQRRRNLSLAGLAVLVATTTAPVAAQMDEAAVWDPLETVNRATFAFNETAAMTLTPVAAAYHETVPDWVKAGISNVFTNLREPLTTVSSGLQGDFTNARISASRFVVNLIWGVGGTSDEATEMGLVSRAEDFGAVFCSYGVPSGPYLVLPLIGASTAREATGLASLFALGFNFVGDPALAFSVTDGAVAKLSDTSLAPDEPADAYAAQRDAFLALRDQICEDELPAQDIKMSPLGVIIRKDEPSSP